MNQIDVMKYLIRDAEKELKKLRGYVQIRVLDSKEKLWDPPQPGKQRFKDDLKMIRRLSLEAEREVDKLW